MVELKEIKQALFARRNGLVADALRKAGDGHEFIMGCQLGEISDVATRYEPSVELAQALWNEAKHRECRLMASMLMPPQSFDKAMAMQWCNEAVTHEECDVMCHRLLRHLDYSPGLAKQLLDAKDSLARYTGFRLLLNLLLMGNLPRIDNLQERVQVERARIDKTPAMRMVLESIAEEL